MWPRTRPPRIWRPTPAHRPGRRLITGCAGSTRVAKKARGASRSAPPLRDKKINCKKPGTDPFKMKPRCSNQLTRQLGEHLVVSKLGRLGSLATPFAGNVPDFDV